MQGDLYGIQLDKFLAVMQCSTEAYATFFNIMQPLKFDMQLSIINCFVSRFARFAVEAGQPDNKALLQACANGLQTVIHGIYRATEYSKDSTTTISTGPEHEDFYIKYFKCEKEFEVLTSGNLANKVGGGTTIFLSLVMLERMVELLKANPVRFAKDNNNAFRLLDMSTSMLATVVALIYADLERKTK